MNLTSSRKKFRARYFIGHTDSNHQEESASRLPAEIDTIDLDPMPHEENLTVQAPTQNKIAHCLSFVSCSFPGSIPSPLTTFPRAHWP